MKKIKKKTLLFSTVFVILCMTAYGIFYMKKLPNMTAKVNATCVTNKVIVVDAGHGLPDERGSWI